MQRLKQNIKMSDNQIFEAEKLSILEFKFLKDQVDTPEDFVIEKVIEYKIENSLQLAFNLEEKLSKVDFSIEITTNCGDPNVKEASGSFHLVYVYKVENLEELTVLNKSNLIEVQAVLTNALSSITYSTSRGILFLRLQGTALQNFMLPIINPNKLLNNK